MLAYRRVRAVKTLSETVRNSCFECVAALAQSLQIILIGWMPTTKQRCAMIYFKSFVQTLLTHRTAPFLLRCDSFFDEWGYVRAFHLRAITTPLYLPLGCAADWCILGNEKRLTVLQHFVRCPRRPASHNPAHD